MASANCAPLRRRRRRASSTSTRPRCNLDLAAVPADVDALVAVHYAGLPVDLAALWRTGPGSSSRTPPTRSARTTPDGPVGNCAHSDMCCFSFHPVKTITTGEGGVVTTNAAGAGRARCAAFRSHGIVRTRRRRGWAYDIAELGYNYRLTDLQAALGTEPARPSSTASSTAATSSPSATGSCFADLEPVTLPPAAPSGSRHGYHLFAVRVPERGRVFDELRERGHRRAGPLRPRSTGFRAYAERWRPPSDFPATEAAYARLLSLPMFPDADRRRAGPGRRRPRAGAAMSATVEIGRAAGRARQPLLRDRRGRRQPQPRPRHRPPADRRRRRRRRRRGEVPDLLRQRPVLHEDTPRFDYLGDAGREARARAARRHRAAARVAAPCWPRTPRCRDRLPLDARSTAPPSTSSTRSASPRSRSPRSRSSTSR